ncbi:NAD(P)-binding domain-containing protein [Stigmatella sp. ncwal1]|uniref:NAD(P)-binding domain-containing protein n=1 Tax=Stigmatella ashevillensis TaxID=2995309 RepID=A0ABT5D8S1_9BACT|nr:NAD(P)-binding domain-containing protein [Stigmatella ashevillena]MDC0710066.1 NAD(P)-binding domain-containing protein [Stigmatella ashevillena]
MNRAMRIRRASLLGLASALALLLLPVPRAHASAPEKAVSRTVKPRKIGIIGTGKIGGALARLWVKAGYEVLISSRHPEELKPLAEQLGPKARVGTPREAAAYGDVVLISVPYGALPQIGRDHAKQLSGKVVLETGNPYPQRDGPLAEEARLKGTGQTSKALLPGVRLVRAFNAISAVDLSNQSGREGTLVGIPIASDDEEALKIASELVKAAGFEPVVVGGLERAKDFDVGTPVYTRLLTAEELRKHLGLPQ